ncbi:hypothetical protein EON65_25255 [archaeon]|nr:MAG: hypothetical protein EON65_25255 [archaeon]
MNSAHTRHNIFKAEPPVLKSKKHGSTKALDSVVIHKIDSPGHGRVSFDVPSQSNSPPVQSPASSPSQSLPEIEWNARKKLAIKDLSVKFSNKSPAFNVASTYGHPSPESTKFGSSNKMGDSYFIYDQEDESSVSKASRHSNTSTRLDLHKESRSNHSKSKHSIAGNSYFFNDNHSIVEVDDEDNYEDTEIEEDLSVQQPHPKTFSSPVDAHRSFVKAARARNQIRSTKSMATSKVIPTDMIASESKKALLSMKKESMHTLPKTSSDAKASSPNSSFYFLTGLLTGKPNATVDDEKSHGPRDVLGQRAPLESTDKPIVERPLLPSTFSRFKIGKEADNPALILRSMESTKQKMKSEFDYDDDGSVPAAKQEKATTMSLYHVPRIQAHENKTFLKTVDNVIHALTFVPSPPKPQPPPPIPKERLTVENVFGEHLIRAKMNKVVPEEEYQKLLKMSMPKMPAKPVDDDATFSTNDWASASYCTINEPLPSHEHHNNSHVNLPRLDFSPLQQQGMQQSNSNTAGSTYQSTTGPYVHLPKINPYHNAHRQVINPQLRTEHSTMKSYLHYMSNRAQQYLLTFIKNRESSGNDKDVIAQKMLEDLQPEAQPLADPDQEYVYQHSTTSFVPKGYVNRSELGYDYGRSPEAREKAVDGQVEFSDRHLSAIHKHTVGVSEPVIYLPSDYTGNKNGIVANLDEESQLRILKVPSSSVTEILRPGYVLSKPNYPDAHDVITSNDRDHILHYNIFEDNEKDSDDEDGKDTGRTEGKSNDRKVPQLTNLPIGHYPRSLDEESFYTNYDPSFGVNNTPVVEVAAAANDDHSVGKRSVLSDDHSLDSFQRNAKQSVSKSAAQQTLHTVPSELDLRDEILTFLQKVNSPLKAEYEQYVQKTSPGQKSQGVSYVHEHAADYGQYDDNSTIASEAPSHVNYMTPLFHSTAHMMNVTPPPATNMTATHQKLWRNLQNRYGKDDEGQYQMQRKVKDYLMEGVKQDYKIKNKYLDEMEEW